MKKVVLFSVFGVLLLVILSVALFSVVREKYAEQALSTQGGEEGAAEEGVTKEGAEETAVTEETVSKEATGGEESSSGGGSGGGGGSSGAESTSSVDIVTKEELKYIDTHDHLDWYVYHNISMAVETALAYMDHWNITKTILMSAPIPPNRSNSSDYEILLASVKDYPDRFAVLGGGALLNPMIYLYAPEEVTPEVEAEFEARAREIIAGGAIGFGEFTAEHFSFRDGHPYLSTQPDHPLFLLLSDLAAEYNVPIDIHMEAVVADMPFPKSRSSLNPANLTENIHAFERLLAHNRDAKIVWVHAGWDNSGNRTVALMRQLLANNSNLYMNIKIRQNVSFPENGPLVNKTLRPEWKELFTDYPDRFMIGNDNFYGEVGLTWGSTMKGDPARYILDQLPEDLAYTIGYENPVNVYNLQVQEAAVEEVCTDMLPSCADGEDNDQDGHVDLEDSDCGTWEGRESGEDVAVGEEAEPLVEEGIEVPAEESVLEGEIAQEEIFCTTILSSCADGLDNDGDGNIDLEDPECTSWEEREVGESSTEETVAEEEGVETEEVPVAEENIPLLGVYSTSIKKSAYSWRENVTATIDGVENIGANLYGYSAWDRDAEFFWPNFLEFLEETKGTNVKILAVVPEKHIISGSSRWGVTSSSSYDAWVDAHVAAAEEFSALAVDYPQFKGFTIDDFGGYPCSATHEIRDADCYTVDDVAAITAAAHTSDADFMFLPTIYYPQFGESLVPGYILGSPYGVQMVDGEHAAMTITFDIDSVPTEVNLSFLHYDTNTDESSYVLPVYKEVWVNNNRLMSDSVNGDEYVEYFNDNIAPYLQEGENEIVLRLYSGGVNFYNDKMWYIWDFSVDGTDFSWKNNETTFSVEASTALYTNNKGDVVENTGRIVAKTNDEYLIDVDGVVAPYRIEQTYYSLENYTTLLESAKNNFGDMPQIVVLYAMFWGEEFDTSILREQTETAASLTDGVLFWSYPLDLYALEEGVYSQRDSPDASYELFAYFPGQQQGIEGWYQTFSSKEPLTGTVEITVKDNWDGTYTPDYFVKKISALETGELYYNDSITGAEGAETVLINLGTEPVTLVLSVEETDGVGNAPAEVYFHVVDNTGNTIDNDAWAFESGTTYQNRHDVYEVLADTFQDINAVRFTAPEVEQGFFARVWEFLRELFS